MTTKALWLLVAIALLAGVAIGLTAPVAKGTDARAAAQIAPADDAWRAALPRDPAAATDAYLARIPASARERSDAYFEGGYWLRLAGFVIGLLVSWALLSSRVLVRVRDAIEARPRLRWLNTVLVAMAFIVLSSALVLPLDAYQGFFREHAFGLATQTFPPWLGERALGAAIGALLGGLFLWAFYAIVRRAPQTWWLWGSALGVAFLAFLLLIGPTYIDPLFNTYRPLADETVKAPILAMARANGVPADNVYQFDASRQTHRISANVSGIFGTAAIRLNDNLLDRTSPPEIKAVMAHEIGHYVLNHTYKILLAYGVILVLGLAFLKWSLGLALRRWGARFGIRGETDPAGLPLLVALFSVYMLAATPLMKTVIRVSEVEADIFGLNASAEPDGTAEVHLKLIEYRKADPGPIEELLFFDHPSPRQRVYAAMRWKAEHASR